MFFMHFCILWNDLFSFIYCFMNLLFYLLFYNSLYPNFCHLLSLTFCGLRGFNKVFLSHSFFFFSPILVWVVSCSGSSSGSGFIWFSAWMLKGPRWLIKCLVLPWRFLEVPVQLACWECCSCLSRHSLRAPFLSVVSIFGLYKVSPAW